MHASGPVCHQEYPPLWQTKHIKQLPYTKQLPWHREELRSSACRTCLHEQRLHEQRLQEQRLQELCLQERRLQERGLQDSTRGCSACSSSAAAHLHDDSSRPPNHVMKPYMANMMNCE